VPPPGAQAGGPRGSEVDRGFCVADVRASDSSRIAVAATSRRVAMYRGVYPVQFEIEDTQRDQLYARIFETLLCNKLVEVDNLVIFTKGDLKGISGSTNAMKILEVKASE